MQPNRRNILKKGGLALFGAGVFSQIDPPARAQRAAAAKADDCNCLLGSDKSPLDTGTSELMPVIERYGVELRDLERVYALPGSALRQSKLETFYKEQFKLLEGIRFDSIRSE